MVREETVRAEAAVQAEAAVRAVRAKAEFLNGGASLGEGGDLLAEIAIQKALAWCQRRDVPEDMEQAVAALALALYRTVPQNADTSGSAPEDETPEDGETPAEGSGPAGGSGPTVSSEPAGDWEALIASGAVKSVQRGDTAITFNTSAADGLSSALSGSAAARLTVEAALAGLAPWRRLGRLRPPEGRPGYGD